MGKGRRAEGKEGHFSFSSDDGEEANMGYLTSAVRSPLFVTRSSIRLATTPHGKTITVCPLVISAGTERDPGLADRDLDPEQDLSTGELHLWLHLPAHSQR